MPEHEVIYQRTLGLADGPDTTAVSSVFQNVGEILRTVPETRANDTLLAILYWCDIQGLARELAQYVRAPGVAAASPEHQAELLRAFLIMMVANERLENAETIRRRRQEWNEKGTYLPDEEIVARRKRLSRAGPQGHRPKNR